MSKPSIPGQDAVDLLMRNAQLRDELEPYLDDSVSVLSGQNLSLEDENEFLESIQIGRAHV